ncbi:MAG TPA: ABC transporter permease [Gaiellaceae bacterium]|jgi:putative ABC transport system permease protein
MTRAALKGLVQRKLRALLTALSVVLGVAMVSGTFMLTDSIQKAFDSIFTSSYAETDVVVSGRPIVEGATSGNPTVSPALLERIRALPAVEEAAGSLVDLQTEANTTKLIDRDGETIGGGDASTLGFGVDPDHPRFTPLDLTEGEWARGPGEVVLDAGTAKSNDYAVGDRIGVAASGPIEQFRISGIATFGDVDSLAGATIAAFDLPTAQRLLRKDGYDSISVAGRNGTSAQELVDLIRPLLPVTAQVESASARAASDSKEVNEFISYLRYALLAFGGIALFVGGFVIFNTLSITVAQRTREFATLRTLGASRRQVLGSVILETLTIGVIASLVGLAIGFVLAQQLGALFGALGLALPEAGTVIAVRTVVASLVVGTAITLLAGLVPALRATRVAPIASVREGATMEARRIGARTTVVAAGLLGVAAATLGVGLFADGVSAQQRLLAVALGSLGGFVGVAMVAPRLVRPLAAVVGFPAQRLGGSAGELARRNAVRNPSRTASTAAALMIGLTLVTTVAVLGQGLRTSAKETVERQVTADYVVTSQNGFDGLPPAVGQRIASVPGIDATSVRSDKAKAFGSTTTVTGVEGDRIGAFYAFRFSQGSEAALAALDRGGAIVRRSYAEKHQLTVGSPLRLVTPSGETVRLRVEALLDQGKFDLDPLLGSVVISQQRFDEAFPRPVDLYTFVNVPEGVITDAMVAQGVERYPGVRVSTRAEFVDERSSGIEQILNLLYVLLALSVVISLFGMVNTLVLAVFERTRELGMLRATGLTRRQTRRMVRHESVITALIGAALGLPLGILLAATVTRSLAEYDIAFSLPVGTLVAFVAVAVVAGVLAAIVPARRASRLDVLEALGYE